MGDGHSGSHGQTLVPCFPRRNYHRKGLQMCATPPVRGTRKAAICRAIRDFPPIYCIDDLRYCPCNSAFPALIPHDLPSFSQAYRDSALITVEGQLFNHSSTLRVFLRSPFPLHTDIRAYRKPSLPAGISRAAASFVRVPRSHPPISLSPTSSRTNIAPATTA